MSLVIALDFDDTFTADPALFAEFVRLAQAARHYVVVVTYRMDSFGVEDIKAALPGIEIVATNGQPKRKYLQENGYPAPNIWIDDMPHLIG